MASSAIGSLSYDDPTTDPSAPKTPQSQDGIGSDSQPTSLYGSTFGTSMPTANSSAPPNPQPDTPPPATYTPAPTPSQTPTPGTSTSPDTSYQGLMTQLQQTTDPQQQAVLKDQLSRQVYSTLQGAGHDVEWDGDQLMVDGRPYVVGGGTTDPNSVGMPGSTNNPNTGVNGGANTSGVSGPSTGVTGSSATYAPIQGFDTTKLQDTSYQDAKYDPALRDFSAALGSGVQVSRGNLGGAVSFAQQNGFPNAKPVGDDKIDFGDGNGPIDVITSSGQIWFQNGDDRLGGAAAPAAGSGAVDPSLYASIFGSSSAPGAAGVNVSTPSYVGPSASDAFTPTAPTYDPGSAPDNSDLTGLDNTDLLAKMPQSAPTPLNTSYQAPTVDTTPAAAYTFNGLGDMGTLGAGPTDQQTQDLVQSILANPESYPPELVAQLKAQQKDELSQMAKSDDQNLTAAGYATGNQDSNWLQSEKLARAGQRDQAIVAGDQNIDLTAAKQNFQDKQAAATLGSNFAQAQDLMNRADAAQKLSEQQAAEGDAQAAAASAAQAATFRQQGQEMNAQNSASANAANNAATATNNANLFQSEDEQRQAVQLAADTTLQAAAVKDDRASLEETIKQKAAELGQSADQIRLQYALGLMSDATQQMGIQVNAANVRAQLAQAGTEFQQNLIFQMAALKQANDQFTATYGISLINAQTAARKQALDEATAGVGSVPSPPKTGG